MGEQGTDRRDGPGRYAIRVRGHLADRWSQQLDRFTLARQPDGTTVLIGAVADQAALHGLLHKIRDLGLPLLSVTPVTPNTTAGSTVDDPAADHLTPEHEADASTHTTTTGSPS